MKQDPVGIILGESMDKAVGATIRAWPFVLAVCALYAVTVEFAATDQGFGAGAVSLLVSPVAAFIGFSTVVPELRFAAAWIVRFLTISALIWAVSEAFVGLPMLAITSAARTELATSWAPLIPIVTIVGGSLTIWLGVKLSLAPTITVYEERSVRDSIARAWHLTTGSFGQTFVLNIAVTFVVVIVYELPKWLGTYISNAYFHAPSTVALVDKLVEVVLAPLMVFGNAACYVSYARFLELLEARAEGRPVDPTKARNPAS